MRIRLIVGVLMVESVDGDPSSRSVLQAADSEHCQEVFQPGRTPVATVGQQPMIAEVDPQRSENIQASQGQRDPVQLKYRGANASSARVWIPMTPVAYGQRIRLRSTDAGRGNGLFTSMRCSPLSATVT